MATHVGTVEALFRYPVKSMRGESIDEAALGWYGLDGDRRLAIRRLDDRAGFPWLTASRLPELILFTPLRENGQELPTHVRTPEGERLEIFGGHLAAEIGRRHGSAVEMMHFNRGIFDEASVSVITSASVAAIADFTGASPDARRFRPNILISSTSSAPFAEDAWVGGLLFFGEGDDTAVIGVTNLDERCAMITYDPDSARPNPEILKAVVRERNNHAGIYATVIRRGHLKVGQPIFWSAARSAASDLPAAPHVIP